MTSAGYRPLPTNETNSAEDAARSPTMEVVVVESVDKRNILETLGQIDDVLEDAAEASLKATRSFVGDFAMFVKDGTSVETSLAILMGMVFSQLIGSMMADLLLPVVGYFIGASLVNEFVVMQPGRVGGPYFTLDEAKKDGAITLNYGQFLQQLLNFLLVTLVLYFVVKGMAKSSGRACCSPHAHYSLRALQDSLLSCAA